MARPFWILHLWYTTWWICEDGTVAWFNKLWMITVGFRTWTESWPLLATSSFSTFAMPSPISHGIPTPQTNLHGRLTLRGSTRLDRFISGYAKGWKGCLRQHVFGGVRRHWNAKSTFRKLSNIRFGCRTDELDMGCKITARHATRACKRKIMQEHIHIQCPYARQVWHKCFNGLNLMVPWPQGHDNLLEWWLQARSNFTRANNKAFDTLVVAMA